MSPVLQQTTDVLLRLQGPLRGHLVSFCWVGQPAALLASACPICPLAFLSLAVCTHVLVGLFKHLRGALPLEASRTLAQPAAVLWCAEADLSVRKSLLAWLPHRETLLVIQLIGLSRNLYLLSK